MKTKTNLTAIRAAYGFSFAALIITMIFTALFTITFSMSLVMSDQSSNATSYLSSLSSFIPCGLYIFAFLSLSRLKKNRKTLVTISLILLSGINVYINCLALYPANSSGDPMGVMAAKTILACSACALIIFFLVRYLRRFNGEYRHYKLSLLLFIILLLIQFGNLYYSLQYAIFSQQVPTLPPEFSTFDFAGLFKGLFIFISILLGIFSTLFMVVPQFIVYKATSDDTFYQFFIETRPVLCWNCRTPIKPDATFCPNCGRPLNPTAIRNQAAFCRQCGSPLQPGSKFCANCGTAMNPPVGFSAPPQP